MKKSQLIALVFAVIAIGAIISAVYNADTYASFSEARLHPEREFHIIGQLLRERPVEEKVIDNTLVLSFYMKDQLGAVAQVIYQGPKPPDFEQSDEVVLIGKYTAAGFVASSLLLKCPSKYKPDQSGPTEYRFD